MKVLIIPDVHLKPWMFSDAEEILKEYPVDQIVCLGDLVDDWDCQDNAAIYQETMDAARKFNHEHYGTYWCYGNHDLAYLWDYQCSGKSWDPEIQCEVKRDLISLYNEAKGSGYVITIDHVFFSHAGISDDFVNEHFEKKLRDDESVRDYINEFPPQGMWLDDSPLWLRPQEEITGYKVKMYRPRKYFQVVGHTPMKQITQEGHLLTCDVFSTYQNHMPYGSQEYCLFDTETWNWKGIKAPSCRKENS